MPQYIGQKLDYLMTLTNTKNNVLGQALGFDNSHISRIRAGERGLPHRRSFVEPASEYFARHIKEPWQIKGAIDAICPGRPWPKQKARQAALIAAWFLDEEEPFLAGDFKLNASDDNSTEKTRGTAFYYGNSGKREAVERFLKKLLDTQKPVTLLLYSDEDMAWLTEDLSFARRWMELMSSVLRNGGKVKIVHDLGRNVSEMLTALQDWLPLYMRGEIEPWFCPRARDDIFHHTRFIARGIAAITASSAAGQADTSSNIYIDDQEMVRCLEKEYDAFLALCKPLMKIYRSDNAMRLFWELSRFEESEGDIISAARTPAQFTLPDATAAQMAKRCDDEWLIERTLEAKEHYAQLFSAGYSITELLHLPDAAMVKAGAIPFPLCDLCGMPELTYTPAELAEHLQGVIELLRCEEHYHVLLTDRTPENITMLCKDGIGALVFPAIPPTTAFAIKEQSLTSAIWEYLRRQSTISDKEQTIAALETYITELNEE